MNNPTGFENIQFSHVQYISVDEAIERFTYLDQMPGVYVRQSVKLSKEELESYEMILSIPTKNDVVIRVMNPYIVYRFDGKEFLINGNSRHFTTAHLRKSDKGYEFAPVPFCYVESDKPLTVDQIERLQYDANDTTRRHRAIDKIKRLQAFLDRAIENGATEKDARKTAVKYFGVSQGLISNAKKLASAPENLIAFLEAEQITTDAAIKIIQFSEAESLTVNYIINKLIEAQDPKKPVYIKSAHVERIRNAHTAQLEEQNRTSLKQFLANEANHVTEIDQTGLSVDESGEALQIDVDAAQRTTTDALPKIGYSVHNARVLGGIVTILGQALPEDQAVALFNVLSMEIAKVTLAEVDPVIAERVANALKSLTERSDTENN